MIEALVSIPDGASPDDGLMVRGYFNYPLGSTETQLLLSWPAPVQESSSGGGGAVARPNGWLQGQWLGGPWLGKGVRSEGFLCARWLADGWLAPRPFRRLELDELIGFGRFTIELVTVNASGQETSSPAEKEITVIEPPESVTSFGLSSYDPVTDVVTFVVTQ